MLDAATWHGPWKLPVWFIPELAKGVFVFSLRGAYFIVIPLLPGEKTAGSEVVNQASRANSFNR